MSMLKKVCDVVMLETSGIDRNNGVVFKDTLENLKLTRNHYSPDIEFSDCEYYHLYILSEDEIKDGDWVLEHSSNMPVKALKDWTNEDHTKNPFDRKIIATTDSSLEVLSKGINPVYEKLPRPSEEFIEDFIIRFNNWNQIEKVKVDYEIKDYTIIRTIPRDFVTNYEPKINYKDNTISTTHFKDKWNRSEVLDLFDKFISDLKSDSEFFKKYGDMPGGIPALRNKWMDEHI